MEAPRTTTYLLGTDPAELARLDRQAAFIDGPTRLLLQSVGIAPGLRVLDLGTGPGHVARLLGELVGPRGAVVGIDRSPDLLTLARHRTADSHIEFVEGDVTTWRAPERFDAIVGRLVLFHLADPIAAVRHHLENLRPGGVFAAIDFDVLSPLTVPAVPLADEAIRWVIEAFAAGGASPRIGARLGVILARAGVRDVKTFGVQQYVAPHDPTSAALIAGVVHSLAGAIVQHGIASAEQVAAVTPERLAEEIARADAAVLPPTVAGAWGRC